MRMREFFNKSVKVKRKFNNMDQKCILLRNVTTWIYWRRSWGIWKKSKDLDREDKRLEHYSRNLETSKW